MKGRNDRVHRQLAQLVRDACQEAARRAYDEAAISGLCEEGRIEMALDAIRSLEIEELLERLHDAHDPQTGGEAS